MKSSAWGLEEKTADQITRSFIEAFNLKKTQVEKKIKAMELSETDSTGLQRGREVIKLLGS